MVIVARQPILNLQYVCFRHVYYFHLNALSDLDASIKNVFSDTIFSTGVRTLGSFPLNRKSYPKSEEPKPRRLNLHITSQCVQTKKTADSQCVLRQTCQTKSTQNGRHDVIRSNLQVDPAPCWEDSVKSRRAVSSTWRSPRTTWTCFIQCVICDHLVYSVIYVSNNYNKNWKITWKNGPLTITTCI